MDARRNREAILDAALSAFSTGGTEPSLEDVARQAGVARATAYRHFPDRYALAQAVSARNVELLAKVVSGGTAPFREVLLGVLRIMVTLRPLLAMTGQLPERERRSLSEAMVQALAPALSRDQERGLVRADVGPRDVLTLIFMLDAGLAALPADEPPSTGQRLAEILVDGICEK